MNRIYKSDIHVHSKYSNKPTIWALKKINCPESYTSPEFIYKSAKKMGMDYVTITDHNAIQGALEIAHLPGVFVSTEVTAYFPDDGCKLHIVILDINEEIFKDVMGLRTNVYNLVAYLQKNTIAHFIAHPLYDNAKLSVETVEKILLLFDVFEVKNGSRARQFNRLITNILHSLTREKLESLANKHNIIPFSKTPWIKAMVGGSDDHSGLFVGRTYTASRQGATTKEFIASIKEQEIWAEGEDGDPLTLAHSIYAIGYSFFKERFSSKKGNSFPFINALLNKVFHVSQERSSPFEKFKLFIMKNLPEISQDYEGRTFEEVLDNEAKKLLNDKNFLESIHSESVNRKIFSVTSYLANRLIYIYTDRLTRMSFSMGITSLIHSLSTMGLIHFFVSPYYIAFHQQHRSKKLMNELENRFLPGNRAEKKQKIALFTDTLHEINGVAITIKRLIETAKNQGVELVVITSSSEKTAFENGVMNFKAVGDFALPEYAELKLHFPPILDVIDYFEKEGFTKIHASTPGTLGLIALFIAKLMDIPISGTYHTDIPQYVKKLTNDSFLENAAWSYMIWFYNQMGEVLVPSSSTRMQLEQRGLASEKIKPLPRWVNTEVFSPSKRNPYLYGLNGDTKFLYVGRVSKEKNLKLLADAFIDITNKGFCSNLTIVGDGPYRKEMEDLLKGYPALFTGFLTGNELSQIYASSDVFVFPSATDTFGNVVLEAQASGLPVIVSDEGGPKELMVDGETGLVVKANSITALADALTFFLRNKEKIATMGRNARHFTETNGINPNEAYHTILNSFPGGEKHCVTSENLILV